MNPYSYYMDVHVRAAITKGLRQKGIDVLTAQEDGRRRTRDPQLLARSTDLKRILFAQDKGFQRLVSEYQDKMIPFFGVVYSKQQTHPVATLVDDLELIAWAITPEEIENQIKWIPL